MASNFNEALCGKISIWYLIFKISFLWLSILKKLLYLIFFFYKCIGCYPAKYWGCPGNCFCSVLPFPTSVFEIITSQGLDNSIRHNNLFFLVQILIMIINTHLCSDMSLPMSVLWSSFNFGWVSWQYTFQGAVLLFPILAPSFHLHFHWKPLSCISHIRCLNDRAAGLHERYGMNLTCHRNKVILRPGWHVLIPMTIIVYYNSLL